MKMMTRMTRMTIGMKRMMRN